MTEENTEIPVVVNEWLEDVKRNNVNRLVSHLNSVGTTIINSYPMAEVHSWDIQKAEAEKIIAAGDSSMPVMAPFLSKVCLAQFGKTTEIALITQVREKAIAVKANADKWADLSAYVNGLRARSQALIEAAETESDAHRILHESFMELEEFRRVNNI